MILRPATFWIEKLQLMPHPEGGYYRETYRSADNIVANLPERYTGIRVCSTAIYFLLEGNQFSAFHRLQSDELWHFYAGSAIDLYMINPEGELFHQSIGPNPDNGDVFQYCIPHNCWFAAQPANSESYTLLGCTVSPGFDFMDFELADRQDLITNYPNHQVIISKFTR